MAKRNAVTAPRPVSRRLSTKIQRERKLQRIALLGFSGAIALVFLVIAFGYYRENIAKAQEPIASVEDRTFSVGDYIKLLKFKDYALDLQVRNLGGLGGNQLQQQINLQRSTMSMQAVEDLIEGAVIDLAAKQTGISLTPDDREASIRKRFLPALKEGETPDEAQRDQDYQANFDRVVAESGLSRDDIREILGHDALREKLEEQIKAQVPTAAEQVQARTVVLDDQESAKAALARIQGGEDFAAVAKDVSTDSASKEKDGDLGWIARGTHDPDLENAAFALPPGQISPEPVQVGAKWYILKAEARETRDLSEGDLSSVRAKAFSDWLDGKKQEFRIARFITSEKQTWAMDQVNKARDRRLRKTG